MRKPMARGVALGLGLLAVLAAIAARADLLAMELPRAEGPLPWILSRVTGFTAYAALAIDVVLGLSMTTALGDRIMRRPHAIELHRWVSPIALALVVGHGAVLLFDGFVELDVLDLIVPFIAPHRPFAVAIGVVAAYLSIVVHASFALRKAIGPTTWRRLHYLSFVAFVAAAAHALLAGSDASEPWALALVGAPVVVVAALAALRITRATPRRSSSASSHRRS